eukprot:Opistho-2@90911
MGGYESSSEDDFVVVDASDPATYGSGVADRMTPRRRTLLFHINGRRFVVEDGALDPTMTLNEFIRTRTEWKGTKLGCGEGGCGACAVLLSDWSPATGVRHRTANSCLRSIASVDGSVVTTIEGLGSVKRGLHPLQQAIVCSSGTQCGFCTPGMIMAMQGLLVNNPAPSRTQIISHMDGNLCRCTGYRSIVSGFDSFAADPVEAKRDCCVPEIEDTAKKVMPCGNTCADCPTRATCTVSKAGCTMTMKPAATTNRTSTCASASCCGGETCTQASPTAGSFDGAAPDVPEELRAAALDPLSLKYGDTHWHRATSVADVGRIIARHKGASVSIVQAFTSRGVYKNDTSSVYIDVKDIPELTVATLGASSFRFGAAVPIAQFLSLLGAAAETLPVGKGTAFDKMSKNLLRIASHHVRNVGSIAGNMTMCRRKGFESDLVLSLGAQNARVGAAVVSLLLASAATSKKCPWSSFCQPPTTQTPSCSLSTSTSPCRMKTIFSTASRFRCGR